jgi:hypothetical protein
LGIDARLDHHLYDHPSYRFGGASNTSSTSGLDAPVVDLACDGASNVSVTSGLDAPVVDLASNNQ